ncbi:MAG TPA: TonB-dependent receptor [Terriglobales bacterium]|nr:TonB-dependent receptor [Terriglobales bacterium]
MPLWGQANPTGTLAGTVMDPSNAAIPGAKVQVKGAATGITLAASAGADGHFSIANVAPGEYTVSVTAPGFETGTYQAVTIVANQAYNLKAVLKVGTQSASVTVEAGQSVIQSEQTSVGTSITGKVITDLPSASSSSALYSLTQTDPAIQTMGAPRQSSAEGLPGGAINITIDGISAQWESGKSGDPIFTMITPNVSDTSEFDVVSAAGSANQTGEGAVQINFTSNRGTNAFHGSVFDYFRNDALNSNYYFNNLSGQPRPVMRFNQYGFSIGGPIWKNKLFFFFDMTRFTQPEGAVQNATILNPDAASGILDYTPQGGVPSSTPSWVTCSSTSGTPLCKANLLQMAAANGFNSTPDPFINTMLGQVSGATKVGGVTFSTPPSTYQQLLNFPLSGSNAQTNPDFRGDYNINQNHSLEFDYHLSRLIIFPDDLNGGGYTYPVAPFNTNQFGYGANRAIWSLAWRWAVSPSQSNELRVGFQNSPSSFNFNQTPTIYPTIQTNVGAIRMQPTLPSEMTDPYLGFGPTQEWDNVYQLNDTFAWVRGNHNLTMGATVSRALFMDVNSGNEVAQVGVGLSGNEPAEAAFTTGNLPGISNADLVAAGDIYGLVTGNVTSYSSTVAFDPTKRTFVTGLPGVDKYHQTDLGLFFADNWRVRNDLTFNYGLRWQYEGVPVDDYNQYFIADGGVNAAYGVSGAGNLFKPGTLTGAVPTFTNDLGKQWYNNWYKGFAPSVGISWQPRGGWFGQGGETVLRAGYSIAYSREGLENWNSIAAGNPGFAGTQDAEAAPVAASQPAGLFNAGSIQIGGMNIPAVVQTPATFQSQIALNPLSTSNSVNVFDPNLHMPSVQSWSAGIQRSLGQHTALEVRYVGNHGVGLWQQLNLNETNIFESGFLQEFKQAQANLAASGGKSFADQGLAGQAPVPILTAAFTGSQTGAQSDPNFSNGTFIRDLNNGQAGTLANSLATTFNFWQNFTNAGYPSNLLLVNPDAQGGSFELRNGLQSTYNALIVEVRHRPLHGLTVNASYTFSKSLTDDWQRSGANFENEVTLRDPTYMKGPAPFDIRNAFKFFSIWELPFGQGHRWGNANGLVNDVIGGWSFDSNILLQSGRPTLLTGGLGGTFDQYDGGVILSGMSTQQLQSQLGVYKTPSPAPGAVWYLPQSLLGANGAQTNTQVLQACNTPGALCQRMFLYDAPLFLPDFSLVKDTKLTERIGSQIQVQFLNAFNNANFFWGGAAETFNTASKNLQSTTFGRVTQAYQAVDSNSDHGGRTIQIVAKITF